MMTLAAICIVLVLAPLALYMALVAIWGLGLLIGIIPWLITKLVEKLGSGIFASFAWLWKWVTLGR